MPIIYMEQKGTAHLTGSRAQWYGLAVRSTREGRKIVLPSDPNGEGEFLPRLRPSRYLLGITAQLNFGNSRRLAIPIELRGRAGSPMGRLGKFIVFPEWSAGEGYLET